MRAAGHTSEPCDVRSAGAASPSKAGAAAGACAACAVALARAIPQAPAVAASKAAQSQNSAWGASCVSSAGGARQLLRRRMKQTPCGEGRDVAHLGSTQQQQQQQQRRSGGSEARLRALRPRKHGAESARQRQPTGHALSRAKPRAPESRVCDVTPRAGRHAAVAVRRWARRTRTCATASLARATASASQAPRLTSAGTGGAAPLQRRGAAWRALAWERSRCKHGCAAARGNARQVHGLDLRRGGKVQLSRQQLYAHAAAAALEHRAGGAQLVHVRRKGHSSRRKSSSLR